MTMCSERGLLTKEFTDFLSGPVFPEIHYEQRFAAVTWAPAFALLDCTLEVTGDKSC